MLVGDVVQQMHGPKDQCPKDFRTVFLLAIVFDASHRGRSPILSFFAAPHRDGGLIQLLHGITVRDGAIEIGEGLLHLVGAPSGLAPIHKRIRNRLGRVPRGFDQRVAGRDALLSREGAVVVCGADCSVGVALGAGRRGGDGGEQAKDDADGMVYLPQVTKHYCTYSIKGCDLHHRKRGVNKHSEASHSSALKTPFEKYAPRVV